MVPNSKHLKMPIQMNAEFAERQEKKVVGLAVATKTN